MVNIKTLKNEISESLKEFSKISSQINYLYQQSKEKISIDYDETKKQINRKYKDQINHALEEYNKTMNNVLESLASEDKKLKLAELLWDSEVWENYSYFSSHYIPYLTRAGVLTAAGKFDCIEYPALLPIIGGKNLLLYASNAGKERARNLLQILTLRMLAAAPPGKIRLICIDPVGLGSNVAGFIKGLPDSITGSQAWFNQHDIEKALSDLENHMAFVKQKYLGVSFSSMEEYNAKADQIEEPYRLLIISDFPARFSDLALQRLVSITQNGPGTGVYSLIMVDVDQPKPYNFSFDDIRHSSTVIECNECEDIWIDEDFQSCQLTLDSQISSVQFERNIETIKEKIYSLSDIKVPFSNVVPKETNWWINDSRSGVQIPIGQFGAREIQYLSFDEKLLNSALIIGKPGSGKSTLLHIIINGLACAYSPNELQFFLLDFKQVEFMDYAQLKLPHAKVVAVKSEREFGLSVLRGLNTELQYREDLFRNTYVTTLSEYRTKTNSILPRIVLLADEFQELFSIDDGISLESDRILDRLIRQGRAFGINVILATQTLSAHNTFSNSTKNQVQIRIALQCSDYDSRLVLSDENDRARLLERPGEAIFNSKNGLIEGNNRFQIFWLEEDEREQYLKRYLDLQKSNKIFKNLTPIVFNGDSLPDLENNIELINQIKSSSWPQQKRGNEVLAWLGEPIDIKPPICARFLRQSRSNLLMLGQNEYEQECVGIMMSALLSVTSQISPPNLQLAIANLIDVDSPWSDLPKVFSQINFHENVFSTRRNFITSIKIVFDVLRNRIEKEPGNELHSMFLFIFGLHKARDLRRNNWNNSFNDSNDLVIEEINPCEQLKLIIHEGPDVGIHTIVWCDTHQNFMQIFDDRNVLDDFDMRVALQMSANESQYIVDSEIASKIGKNKAVFYDQGRSGRIEKFRPYDIKTDDWYIAHLKDLEKKI